MSLKTAIATLLVVALLEQCAAFRLNFPKTNVKDHTLRDFTFKSDEADGQAILEGQWPGLTAYPAMKNTTAWRQVSNPDSKAIEAKIKFENVHLDYFRAAASYGRVEDHGKFNVMFTGKVFTLTLTAQKSAAKCELGVKVEGSDVRPEINMENLGDAGSFFEQEPLKEKVETELAKLLITPLTNILSDNVKYDSHYFRNINKTVLCEEIHKSDANHIPQPDIWG